MVSIILRIGKIFPKKRYLNDKNILLIKFLLLFLLPIIKTYPFTNYQNQFRSSLSSVSLLHAVSSNPALLASSGYPTFGIQLPIPLSLTIQISNSVLTLPNPVDFFLNSGQIDKWIARMLIESFQLEGLSAEGVSSRISSFSNRDIKLWMFAEMPYLKIAHKKYKLYNYGWGFDIVSFFDGYVNVPGQIFALVFSTEKGLQPGNLISFETLKTCTEFVTEFRSAWAKSFDFPVTLGNTELFKNVQIGFGITQRFGHAYYSLCADTLMLDYKNRGVMNIRGNLSITSSGIESNGSIKKLNINGYGMKFSTSAILQNDHIAISAGVNNIGYMGWYKNNRSTYVQVSKDSVFLYDIINPKNDSLIKVTSYTPPKIHYGLSPALFGLISKRIPIDIKYHAISTYQLFSFGGQLSSTRIGNFGHGCALSFDIESGIDYGKIPFRIGWTYAQDKNISSTLSLELMNHQLTYDIWYRAVGDWLFRSKKGAEIGFCFHIYTGFKKPYDKNSLYP